MSHQQITEENMAKLTIENSELRHEIMELKEKISKLEAEKFTSQKQIDTGGKVAFIG